MVCTTNRTGR